MASHRSIQSASSAAVRRETNTRPPNSMVSLLLIVVAIAVHATPTRATGQTIPCNDGTLPSVPTGNVCDTPNFQSQCWNAFRQTTGLPNPFPAGDSKGFGFNLDLSLAAVPGDYMPVSLDPAGGSQALVPAPGYASLTGAGAFARPVLGGLDLITGQPLILENDLDLPFGGAVFRMTRTYSQAAPLNQPWATFSSELAGQYWDWAGVGWMIGENPILLVDMSIPEVVGDSNKPLRSYFVADAHHSIPFDFHEDNGVYEAPPRFAARLTYDRNAYTWHPPTSTSAGYWTPSPPPTYDVWLNDTVKYTFRVNRDDIPEFWYGTQTGPAHMSWHDRPEATPEHNPVNGSPGAGVPYYGLLESIEDRAGNQVLMHYCEFRQSSLDLPGNDCVECQQNCFERGQLSFVELRAHAVAVPPDVDAQDGRRTAWTIVYAHRQFQGSTVNWTSPVLSAILSNYPLAGNPGVYSLWNSQNAISAAFVYKGQLEHKPSCFTIPQSEYTSTSDPNDFLTYAGYCDTYDELAWYNAHNTWSLSQNWQYRVKHLYSRGAPFLWKTTVTRRVAPDQHGPEHGERQASTLYLYDNLDGSTPENQPDTGNLNARLTGVIKSDAVATLERAFHEFPEQNAGWSLNKVITDRDSTNITYRDPRENEPRTAKAIDFASQRFDYPHQGNGFNTDPANYLIGQMQPHGYLFGSWQQFANIGFGDVNVCSVGSDRPGETGHYRLFWLLHFPVDVPEYQTIPEDRILWDPDGANGFPRPCRSLFHQPYAYGQMRDYQRIGDATWMLESGSLADPVWTVIIDQFDTREHAQSPNYQNAIGDGQLTRRVLSMNAAGLPLVDRTWSMQNGRMIAGSGIGTCYTYYDKDDEHFPSYLKEIRSVGFNAAIGPMYDPHDPHHDGNSTTAGDYDGLIQFFKYDESLPIEFRGEPVATGVRKGLYGDDRWLTQTVRDPLRPDQVVARIQFTKPPESLLDPSEVLLWLAPPSDPAYIATVTRSEYDISDLQADPHTRRLLRRKTIGPPAKVTPDSDLYYPVSHELFDVRGNLQWQAQGVLKNPNTPGQGDPRWERMSVHFYDRDPDDDQSRTHFSVLDTISGPLTQPVLHDWNPPYSFTVPTFPTGLVHLPTTEPPLQYVTVFRYDYGAEGLCDTYFPNGRSWKLRHGWDGGTDDAWKDSVYNDLVWREEGGGPGWHALTPGEITITPPEGAANRPTQRLRVMWTGRVETNQWLPADHEVLADSVATYDTAGRPGRITATDHTNSSFMSVVTGFDDLGEVTRQVDATGTITRQVRDSRGRPQRLYRGTKDLHWEDVYSPGQTLPPYSQTFNMVMTERYGYGANSHDVFQLIETRRFTDESTYSNDPYGDPPAADTEGRVERYGYDWRMRRVRVDKFAEGDPNGSSNAAARLESTFTYLDHLDRVRFVATFIGSNAITAPDPVELEEFPESTLESFRAQLINSGARTVTETVYGNAGKVEEERTYNLEHPSGTPPPPIPTSSYTATRRYYDSGGQVLFQQSPNSGVQLTTLDGVGRVKRVATCAPRLSGTTVVYDEMSATDSIYDPDGNVIETVRWERLHDKLPATYGSTLDATNAVRSRSFHWYDLKKRVIASAELGTENPSEGFVSTSAPHARPTIEPDATTITRPSGLPAEAIFSWNKYEPETGNLIEVHHPNGAVSKYAYDGFGQRISVMENADETDPSKKQTTTYAYDAGRVMQMAAARAKPGETATLQTTNVSYGGAVVSRQQDGTTHRYLPISADNNLVRAVYMPTGGLPDTVPDLSFTYFTDGLVAERVDKRGVVVQYGYDDLRRISSTIVLYPASMTPPGGVPADRLDKIEYTYDPASGELIKIKARCTTAPTQLQTVAEIQLDYDLRGNLATEWQMHGNVVSSTSPKIEYVRQFAVTGPDATALGLDRLTTMIYPLQPGRSTRRTVTLAYGATGSAHDMLSRITSIDTIGTQNIGNVASFDYCGTDRRVRLDLAGGRATQQARSSSELGYLGFDEFGRVADLTFRNYSGTTLFGAQYTYDVMGNRVAARHTRQSGPGTPVINERSQANAYDALDRLTDFKLGQLSFNPTTHEPEIAAGAGMPAVREAAWTMDNLGNWTGNTSGIDGKKESGIDNGGVAANRGVSHTTTPTNAISQINTTGLGSGPPVTIVYDAAGNLVYTGLFFYQYDAWDRLLQVNQVINPMTFNPDGTVAATSAMPGPMLKSYTYDGLGRLIRTVSPWPDVATAGSWRRTEHFYYDGVRRIQEVRTDPMLSGGDDEGAMAMGIGAMQQELANSEIDGGTVPAGYEQAQKGAPNPIGYATWIDREYIWGPDALDELLCQIDRFNNPWWVIQDGGGDAVALIQPVGTNDSRVVHQRLYDPYGECLEAETLYTHAELRIGHKGLFFDRLDAGVSTPQGVDIPQFVAGGFGQYQNRNRLYCPSLGRFLQRDPNATALALIERFTRGGEVLEAKPGPFDLRSLYGSGASLYQYLGGNAWDRSDALGLFFGYDDLASTFVGGMRGGLDEMIGQYADNMLGDVEWATDWDMGDDWHSRSDNKWVNRSFALGFYRGMVQQVRGIFFVDEIEEGYDYFMTDLGGEVRAAGKAGKAVRGVMRSMRDLNRLAVHATKDLADAARKAAGGAGHSHHGVEQQLGKEVSWRKALRKGGGPCVVIKDTNFHLSYMRKEIDKAYSAAGIKNIARATRKEAIKAINIMYKDAPRLRNECLKYIQGR